MINTTRFLAQGRDARLFPSTLYFYLLSAPLYFITPSFRFFLTNIFFERSRQVSKTRFDFSRKRLLSETAELVFFPLSKDVGIPTGSIAYASVTSVIHDWFI